MYTVYTLIDCDGHLYKGMTNNLARRLVEHRSGKTRSTRHMREIDVVYTEHFPTRAEARSHEKYLKTAAGRRFLKKQIRTRSSDG